MPPLTAAQRLVILDLTFLVLLWFSRDPGFFTGWAELIGRKTFVTDGTVAIFATFPLFLIPFSSISKSENGSENTLPLSSPVSSQVSSSSVAAPDPLISIIQQLPWNSCILLGGGFALAEAFSVSGTS